MDASAPSEAAGRVLEVLFGEPAAAPNRALYAVFDGARDPTIHGRIRASGLPATCLFRGPIDPALEEHGPWLVRLEREAPAARALVRDGWGRSWGICCETVAALPVLARHLRGFLRVRSPEGRKMFFRFYDPRVLRLYLPTLDPAETRRFGGPVLRYLLENDDGSALLEYVPAASDMVLRTVPLTTPRAAVAG